MVLSSTKVWRLSWGKRSELDRRVRQGGPARSAIWQARLDLFLEKLGLLLAAFHARVAWAQEGHGAQSLTHLLDVSRILTSVSFVTFAAALSDLFGLGLRPFTLQMQGILQPSAFLRAEKRALR
jgi:hypothetical protein